VFWGRPAAGHAAADAESVFGEKVLDRARQFVRAFFRRVVPAALDHDICFSVRAHAWPSVLGWRQGPLLLENAEPLLQHDLGIDRFVKPGLAKLYCGEQGRNIAAFIAVAEAGIGILKREPDELLQRGR
jgi:hypothetical protein